MCLKGMRRPAADAKRARLEETEKWTATKDCEEVAWPGRLFIKVNIVAKVCVRFCVNAFTAPRSDMSHVVFCVKASWSSRLFKVP